jgi:hypothetical protein
MLNTSQGLPGIVNSIVGIVNTLIPVLVALALVLFFIGVVKYIKSEGEKDNRTTMLWGLVVLFVLLSMWGILRLMCNTLIGSGSCAAPSGGSANYGNSGTLPPVY